MTLGKIRARALFTEILCAPATPSLTDTLLALYIVDVLLFTYTQLLSQSHSPAFSELLGRCRIWPSDALTSAASPSSHQEIAVAASQHGL